jgi:hypothetical protein
MKSVSGVSQSNPLNGHLQSLFKGILGGGLRLTQRDFEFALGLLDMRKVEVEQDLYSACPQPFSQARQVMNARLSRHIAATEARSQNAAALKGKASLR